MTTIAVFYDRRMVAAVAGNGDIELRRPLAELGHRHPDRRWAAGLATFARLVQTGAHPGPYTEAAACAFARARLLPTQEFAPLAVFSDRTLAAYFAVPVAEVRAQRSDLGLAWN